jgi:hypothetical protein
VKTENENEQNGMLRRICGGRGASIKGRSKRGSKKGQIVTHVPQRLTPHIVSP